MDGNISSCGFRQVVGAIGQQHLRELKSASTALQLLSIRSANLIPTFRIDKQKQVVFHQLSWRWSELTDHSPTSAAIVMVMYVIILPSMTVMMECTMNQHQGQPCHPQAQHRMRLHWFPGHWTKTIRNMKTSSKPIYIHQAWGPSWWPLLWQQTAAGPHCQWVASVAESMPKKLIALTPPLQLVIMYYSCYVLLRGHDTGTGIQRVIVWYLSPNL